MRSRVCSGGGGLVRSLSSQRGNYKNAEGPCRDHGEKGVRECGHPCSCVAGRFLELRGNKTPRHRVSELEICNRRGERARTLKLDKGSHSPCLSRKRWVRKPSQSSLGLLTLLCDEPWRGPTNDRAIAGLLFSCSFLFL